MSEDHDCSNHSSTAVADPVEPPSTEFPEGEVPNFLDLEPTDVSAEKVRPLSAKIRFAFRDDDETILTRIEIASEEQFNELFADGIRAFGVFLYALQVKGPDGQPMLGHDGQPVSSIEALTGVDIEQCLMDLSRMQLAIAPRINRLKNRYIYAKMNAGDAHDIGWRSVAHGTTGDRGAKGNIDSAQDRYHAYFCYHLWSTASSFNEEITNFVFRLRDLRNWRVQAQPR